MKPFHKLPAIPVRFFICDAETNYEDAEVDEITFLRSAGVIGYERHTVFENGVNQICLTKSES